jgi:hypothetical protein
MRFEIIVHRRCHVPGSSSSFAHRAHRLLAHLYRDARLETKFKAGAECLILNPGQFVVQTISCTWSQSEIWVPALHLHRAPNAGVGRTSRANAMAELRARRLTKDPLRFRSV